MSVPAFTLITEHEPQDFDSVDGLLCAAFRCPRIPFLAVKTAEMEYTMLDFLNSKLILLASDELQAKSKKYHQLYSRLEPYHTWTDIKWISNGEECDPMHLPSDIEIQIVFKGKVLVRCLSPLRIVKQEPLVLPTGESSTFYSFIKYWFLSHLPETVDVGRYSPNDDVSDAKCTHCGGEHLRFVTTCVKQPYSLYRGLMGFLCVGPLGLIFGKGKVESETRLVCSVCKHRIV